MTRAIVALLVAGLVSTPALAELCLAPPDASKDAPQCIDANTPAPAQGVWTPTSTAARLAKRCADAESDRALLQKTLEEKPVDVDGGAKISLGTAAIIAGAVAVVALLGGVVLGVKAAGK